MKKYILLGYSIFMFTLTTGLMAMLYPHLDCVENKIIAGSFAICGYLGTAIAFKAYSSIKKSEL
jgi:hypothetical protein